MVQTPLRLGRLPRRALVEARVTVLNRSTVHSPRPGNLAQRRRAHCPISI